MKMSIEAQKFEALKQQFVTYGHTSFALCCLKFWSFHPDRAPSYRSADGFQWIR